MWLAVVLALASVVHGVVSGCGLLHAPFGSTHNPVVLPLFVCLLRAAAWCPVFCGLLLDHWQIAVLVVCGWEILRGRLNVVH